MTTRMGIQGTQYPVSLSPAQAAEKKKPKKRTIATISQASPASNKFAYALGRYVGQVKTARQKW
jgi:hypothetical protein